MNLRRSRARINRYQQASVDSDEKPRAPAPTWRGFSKGQSGASGVLELSYGTRRLYPTVAARAASRSADDNLPSKATTSIESAMASNISSWKVKR